MLILLKIYIETLITQKDYNCHGYCHSNVCTNTCEILTKRQKSNQHCNFQWMIQLKPLPRHVTILLAIKIKF